MDVETASRSADKCWPCVPSPCAMTAALVCVTMLFSGDVVSAEQASEVDQSDSQHSDYSTVPIVACVSAVAFLVLAVYVLASCMDCYNSEVSTDFHPATGQTEVKWGGAGGYSAGTSSSDVVLGAGFRDQVFVPGQGGQALPYTMIPAQVPEAQGFRGYGAAPAPAPAPTGLRGYSAAEGLRGYSAGEGGGGNPLGGGMGQGGGRRLPGAHVSPVGPGAEDPPPPYM